MEYQVHYDKKFYLDKKKGYWISTTAPKIRAHVWVWKNNNGDIPKGYHVHHVDFNKSNNNIQNLSLIKASEHLSLHSSSPKNIERIKIKINEIRPLTKAWHASKEGREWHRQNAIKCKFGRNQQKIYICQVCCIEYKTFKLSGSKFCSNNCKSSFRRKSGLDDIVKICPVCNIEFKANKYSKSKNCGRTCGGIFKSKQYKRRRS